MDIIRLPIWLCYFTYIIPHNITDTHEKVIAMVLWLRSVSPSTKIYIFSIFSEEGREAYTQLFDDIF